MTGTTAQRSRRFLFVMHYPGYLRYFDSAIRLLVERGHDVELVFDSPHKQPEGIEALADLNGAVRVLGRMPNRRDIWAVAARAVRGAMDYLRYLHPDFADTPYLRERMRGALPPVLGFLAGRRTASPVTVRGLIGALNICERAIPSSDLVEDFIRSRQPDAVIITPLVTDRSQQVDDVKSAHALGIPAALCVASWDHLTTKGLIRVQPDLVAVWNEEQKREALAYHGMREDRLVVTGAQPFDRWFTRQPSPRAAFCAKVGLPVDRPYVLFVGSTASISAPDAELAFVRRWIAELRREPSLAGVGILVRPHPYNSAHWATVDVSDLEHVAVYPRSANPVNESDRQDYFDSLHHSEAVVGVNTTAMIEAAIVGRTVHSVLADEFRDTQEGTLHFRYLLAENGGFLRIATSLPEHARQVAETLRAPDTGRAACARFVARFIRPRGIGQPSTPILVDALERMVDERERRGLAGDGRVPVALKPLSALLWAGAAVAIYRDTERLKRLIGKQVRIAEKQVHSLSKRRHKTTPPGPDAARRDAPRRKVG